MAQCDESDGARFRVPIRRDPDRQRLRELLLDGAGSAPGVETDAAYFDRLRQRVRREL